jgi:hypothetical protein
MNLLSTNTKSAGRAGLGRDDQELSFVYISNENAE